jgi:hypothetical protein
MTLLSKIVKILGLSKDTKKEISILEKELSSKELPSKSKNNEFSKVKTAKEIGEDIHNSMLWLYKNCDTCDIKEGRKRINLVRKYERILYDKNIYIIYNFSDEDSVEFTSNEDLSNVKRLFEWLSSYEKKIATREERNRIELININV